MRIKEYFRRYFYNFDSMHRAECKNCEQSFVGNFCPNCGQSAHEHRVDAHYFLHDIPHSVLHVDSGFFYTIKMLFTKPGLMIRDFLEGKRVRYFRPVAFVMVMTALSALLVKLLDWGSSKLLLYKGVEMHQSHNFFEHYFSLFIFLMIPLATLVTWLFFINRKYSFWEHFLANTYIAAQLNFMWILMHIITFFGALFTTSEVSFSYTVFLVVFMMFFMYLYGSVFGFLMHPFFRSKFSLILMLTLMNIVLSILYSYGFELAGLIDS